MRFIGDVHGLWKRYVQLASEVEYSFQVGDMGFDYGFYKGADLLPANHKFIGGNHDNYGKINLCLHSLGDFGTWRGIFYVRGAWSIDRDYREPGVSWWEAEEIAVDGRLEAMYQYVEQKPTVVVTHDGPRQIVANHLNSQIAEMYGFHHEKGYIPTDTGRLLTAMFDSHQPDLWVFGHHHRLIHETVRGTEFICLPELAAVDIPLICDERQVK